MDDPKAKPFADDVTQKLSSKLSDLATKEKEAEVEKATALGFVLYQH